jgi:hypothetical protein
MVLLDKLMRRLRETGHRVLIFSQVSSAHGWRAGREGGLVGGSTT